MTTTSHKEELLRGAWFAVVDSLFPSPSLGAQFRNREVVMNNNNLVDRNQKVTDFIKENQTEEDEFVPLLVYFHSLKLKDLRRFTQAEITDAAKPEDKLLMKKLVEDVLLQYLKTDNPFDPLHLLPNKVPAETKITSLNYANMSKKVCSKKFKGMIANLISIDELGGFLDKNFGLSKVTVLDLSSNNLFDEDLPEIASLVAKLPALNILNLSYNRFYGVPNSELTDAPLIQILHHGKIEFVDITVNAFASVDRKGFFAKLKEEELSRLIWIPSSWLKAGHWKILIPEKDYHGIVENAHNRYFQI